MNLIGSPIVIYLLWLQSAKIVGFRVQSFGASTKQLDFKKYSLNHARIDLQ